MTAYPLTARRLRAARRLRRALRLQRCVKEREVRLFLAGSLDVLPCRGLREAAVEALAKEGRR